MEKTFEVTFIIPTLGRTSLPNAIRSILAQTDVSWKAIVVFDGFDSIPDQFSSIFGDKKDERISVLLCKSRQGEHDGLHGRAGRVRNFAFDSVTTSWIAFLDDDDCLTPDYVKVLRKCCVADAKSECFLFQAVFDKSRVLPSNNTVAKQAVICGETPISFAVKTAIIQQKDGVKFNHSATEDYEFVAELKKRGYSVKLIQKRLYLVRDSRILLSTAHQNINASVARESVCTKRIFARSSVIKK